MTDSESKKILLVDDAPDTIEVLKRNLESKGNIVFTSYSVQEAIKVLKKEAVKDFLHLTSKLLTEKMQSKSYPVLKGKKRIKVLSRDFWI